jgi:hypothetical protein
MTSLPALRKQLVALALQIGENEGYPLDFSPQSVQEVEAILASLHEYYVQTKNEDGLFGIALEFGAYLIEVIERNYPPKGRWRRDHPDLGKNTFPFEWRGATIFPVAWCQKRIWDGPGDDVVSKFEMLVVQRQAHSTDA